MKEKFHRDMGSETTKYVMKLCSYAKDGSPVYETTYVLNQNGDEWEESNNAFKGWHDEALEKGWIDDRLKRPNKPKKDIR